MTISLEREVKFRIGSWEEGERRLLEAGAVLKRPRYFEKNSLFDFPGARLEGGGEALRLRRASGRAWLTFKGSVHGAGPVKQRKEYESAVEDAQAVEAILMGLGLLERFQYEKYRAVYTVGDMEVCLDDAPMGVYLELEGLNEEIESVARRMGLPMEEALTLTYPQLYRLYREKTPYAPEFMIFVGEK